MPPLTMVFDACVLDPAPLRDLLMRLALTGLFAARWTDFPSQSLRPHGLASRHPDDFVTDLIDRAPATVFTAVAEQRNALCAPPLSTERFLDVPAAQRLPRTLALLRQRAELI